MVLEESFAGKAVRPLALRGLARLLLDETDQSPTGENGRHGSAQTLRVLRLIQAARAQPPANLENYRLLEEAWGKSEASPTSAQFAELAEAVKSHPRESALLLKIARLAARHGLHAEAARTAERGLAFALMPETRAGFTQVIAAARDRK